MNAYITLTAPNKVVKQKRCPVALHNYNPKLAVGLVFVDSRHPYGFAWVTLMDRHGRGDSI